MPNAKVPAGIGPPNALTQTINTTDTATLEDLTTVTGISLNVKRADGSFQTWSAYIVSATVETLVFGHAFATADTTSGATDIIGPYHVVAMLTVPGGVVPCYARVLAVTDRYAC